jgi:hypothetical protein
LAASDCLIADRSARRRLPCVINEGTRTSVTGVLELDARRFSGRDEIDQLLIGHAEMQL